LEKSSKSQAPSPREIPNLKLQFELLEFGASLELGTWDLGLREGERNEGEPDSRTSVLNSVLMFLGGLAGLP
jgi:hypothetical protein